MKGFLRFKGRRGIAFALVLVMVIGLVINTDISSIKAKESFSITEAQGWLESAYVKWEPVANAVGYKAYVKEASANDDSYVKLDDELIRQYAD